jgi:hypothetical protein
MPYVHCLHIRYSIPIYVNIILKEGTVLQYNVYILSPHKAQYFHITEVTKQSIATVFCCLLIIICHLSKTNSSLIEFFGSSYLCEEIFSQMKMTKPRYWSHLTAERLKYCLRLYLDNYEPSWSLRKIFSVVCQFRHRTFNGKHLSITVIFFLVLKDQCLVMKQLYFL